MTSASQHFPLLVADIGGTNARFAWVEAPGAALANIDVKRCEHYAHPEDAALAYLDAHHGQQRPRHCALAVASPVGAGPVRFTNSPWVLDRASFAARTGCASVELFNDFEAVALVLPHLTADDMTLVGGGTPDRTQPMAVIGPGTGLGMAGIVPVRGRSNAWQAVCGEGGHATLAPQNDYQSEILKAARREHTHISAERLVSGIGLPTLRRAVAAVEGLDASEDLSADEIGTRGSARTDRLCEQTVEAFCCFLGNAAGNLALTLAARGGVFIAGGIVRKLGDFFPASGFRRHFEAKGRYAEYLHTIATPVITTEYPALLGLVHNASLDQD